MKPGTVVIEHWVRRVIAQDLGLVPGHDQYSTRGLPERSVEAKGRKRQRKSK